VILRAVPDHGPITQTQSVERDTRADQKNRRTDARAAAQVLSGERTIARVRAIRRGLSPPANSFVTLEIERFLTDEPACDSLASSGGYLIFGRRGVSIK